MLFPQSDDLVFLVSRSQISTLGCTFPGFVISENYLISNYKGKKKKKEKKKAMISWIVNQLPHVTAETRFIPPTTTGDAKEQGIRKEHTGNNNQHISLSKNVTGLDCKCYRLSGRAC